MALAIQKANQQLSEKTIDGFIEQLARGASPHEVAKRVHPSNRIARQRLRRELQKALIHDHRVAEAIGQRAKAEMLVGLIPANKALARRAGRGNIPAIKLLNEATGFHNPRVRHEHSGEIVVKLDMPRPTFEQDATAEDDEPADVVD